METPGKGINTPNSRSGKGNATPTNFKQNGRTGYPSPSPHVLREEHMREDSAPPRSTPSPRAMRRDPTHTPSPGVMRKENSTSQAHHLTRIICNSLWGQKLTFHPFQCGEAVIPFPSLWPARHTLVDTFREAGLDKQPYELCKLLLATNSCKALDALLDEQALRVECDFGVGCGTLMHLTAALGISEAVQNLVRRSQANTKIWSTRDGDGHIPEEVCMKAELRRLVPSHSLLFSRKNNVPVHTPNSENKREVFELATRPNDFYVFINTLNRYPFDVNSERNADGDLLIHVAIQGGLPQLPLFFALVNYYKADVRLQTRSGATPLALAITAGEETLAEVLICVCGVDINEASYPERLSPLHVAVNSSRPRIVNMLLRRGADAQREDAGGGIPSFLASKTKARECRQLIEHHVNERTHRFCEDTIKGTLNVRQLYLSDLRLVSASGCTLLMLAVMHNHETVLRALLRKGDCPMDHRQMKSSRGLVDSLSGSLETSVCESQGDEDRSLKTAVHMAAERGNLGCLQALLDGNAHPAQVDSCGWLPLHYSVDRGHIECVKAILAYPNFLGMTGLKPATAISRGNQFAEITAVLEQAYRKRQEELMVPRLFDVAHSGNVDQLMSLLQNGDNVNPMNESGDWPLLLAAGNGYEEMVAQLHQFGGFVARRHHIHRTTPLHVAARGGHAKVIKYLLQFCRSHNGVPPLNVGALPSGVMEDDEAQFIDINGKNTVGATPLELAASQGHTEVVKLLLENGASTTLPDSNGRLLTCSAFAGTQFLLETHRKDRCRSIIDSLRSHCPLKTFQRCWQGPSDFNLYASNGDNMLMLAAQYAQPEVLRFLLEQAMAVKNTMLISSDESPLLLSSVTSRSDESSDSSLPRRGHSRNLSDSHVAPPRSMLPLNYDPDRDEPARHTALPTVFRKGMPPGRHPDREERLTASGGSAPEKPFRVRGKAGPAWRRSSTSGGVSEPGWRRSSTSGVSSSDDEEPASYIGNGTHIMNSENEAPEMSEPFIRLIRFCNLRDGQSCLHRASAAGRHLNVTSLMKQDEQLANRQDLEGNTALHLACTNMHKQAVRTLLNFKCVMTTLRNKRNEFPEHKCIKSSIKKMVCKVRQSRAGKELGLPDPPSGISVSMERATNEQGGLQPLPRIEEMVTPYSSVDPLSMSDLNTRLQRIKTEISTAPPREDNNA